jgi:hypothetical protein
MKERWHSWALKRTTCLHYRRNDCQTIPKSFPTPILQKMIWISSSRSELCFSLRWGKCTFVRSAANSRSRLRCYHRIFSYLTANEFQKLLEHLHREDTLQEPDGTIRNCSIETGEKMAIRSTRTVIESQSAILQFVSNIIDRVQNLVNQNSVSFMMAVDLRSRFCWESIKMIGTWDGRNSQLLTIIWFKSNGWAENLRGEWPSRSE